MRFVGITSCVNMLLNTKLKKKTKMRRSRSIESPVEELKQDAFLNLFLSFMAQIRVEI